MGYYNKLSLTKSTISLWVSYVAIWTCANWLVIDYFTVSRWSAWISYCTWIDTQPLFTCSIIWTIIVTSAPRSYGCFSNWRN